ncbi:hypothetical protein VdG1_03877 [Verticillium dahliae VDG1]|nr:hypothetical protein VdG1_03877 [Verticillium dahliae VDG1]
MRGTSGAGSDAVPNIAQHSEHRQSAAPIPEQHHPLHVRRLNPWPAATPPIVKDDYMYLEIAKEDDRATLLGFSKTLQQSALKVGTQTRVLRRGRGAQPAGPGLHRGRAVDVRSTEDMAFYDNECAGHAKLKAFVKTVHEGAMMVYFENALE